METSALECLVVSHPEKFGKRRSSLYTCISISSEEIPPVGEVPPALRDGNRRGDFLAGKVARNRRNNIPAVVQTTGTAPDGGRGRMKERNGRVRK